MSRRDSGFTLVELLVTLAILAFVLAGAGDMFLGLLRQFKQQGKIAETHMEDNIGLQMLRQDLDNAGYGLPWSIPAGLTYSEASAAAAYNDAPVLSGTTGTNNIPRAVLSGDGTGLFGSDQLIIKSANMARNATCKKWTYLRAGNIVQNWERGSANLTAAENLSSEDRVIVISPTKRVLTTDGVTWFTTFNDTAAFAPIDEHDASLVYGISGADLRMPFNRADYYITESFLPQRCAPNTGVLVKAMISHVDGDRSDSLPLLDCVADMQVVFRLDTDGDGAADAVSADISDMDLFNAESIRDEVKEVLVYILAHEGQKDPNYVHSPTSIYVGDSSIGRGRNYDIGSRVNYRWKIYTVSVRPRNLK